MKLFSHPIGIGTLGSALQKSLRDAPKGGLLRIAVAYVSVSGVKKLEKYLSKFIEKNGTVEIIAGIDIGNEPVRGILELTRICGPSSVFVFWNPTGDTFHPKVYCLTDAKMKGGSLWIGSSNFTESGLFKNYECSAQLNVSTKDNNSLIEQINEYFIKLRKKTCCQPATKNLVNALLNIEKKYKGHGDRRSPSRFPAEIKNKFTKKVKAKNLDKGFAMILSHNDVSGKRFEPYFLIPVRARDENPHFWGWQDDFSPSKRSGMLERRIETSIHIAGSTIIEKRRIYWVEARDEFRFVSSEIYNLGKSYAGDILHISKTKQGYEVHIIPPSDSRFPALISFAVNLSSNQKKWGYIT